MLVNTYSIGNSVRQIMEELVNQTDYLDSKRLLGADYFSCQFPRVDFSESNSAYLVTAEVPGFDRDDLEVIFENGVLTLKGNRDSEQKNARVLHRERFNGRFVRHFSLPEHIVANKIKSTVKNGILSITIPKSEQAKLREIKISE